VEHIPDPLEMMEELMERHMAMVDENNTYPCYHCGKRFDIDDMLTINERPDSPLTCVNCCEHKRIK